MGGFFSASLELFEFNMGMLLGNCPVVFSTTVLVSLVGTLANDEVAFSHWFMHVKWGLQCLSEDSFEPSNDG